ncbi:hypothetical protein [Amorphus sp. 3PC139-8]|uniref:hypothetical protein n=1 Tax=Amorphus sp. 3PC139-8 TaxID=2735676 RepID=UPI00345DE5FA
MIDWEGDPRPFAEVLHAWMTHRAGGTYGARPKAAEELRVNPATLAGWLAGRPCRHEAAFRRMMALIDRSAPPARET